MHHYHSWRIAEQQADDTHYQERNMFWDYIEKWWCCQLANSIQTRCYYADFKQVGDLSEKKRISYLVLARWEDENVHNRSRLLGLH